MTRVRWLEGAESPGEQAVRRALDETEPVGAETLAKHRVWNRVQAPWADPPARAWRIPLLAGAALGVAVVLLVMELRPAPLVSRVDPVRPQLPAQVVPLPADDVLAPASLTTGPGQRARHQLARGVEAELGPRTALVPGDEPEVRVGRVHFSVPHQPPGRRYVVRAGSYQVVVVGTSFLVAVEDRGVSVAVDSGVVEVQEAATGRRLDRLAEGQRWSSETPPARRPPPRRVAVRAVEPTDPVSAGALDEARQARLVDPGRALALYERLASARGPLAETALYEMGTIENEGLHDPRRALATWERYRERHPRGLLRAEADFSVIEVLTRLREQTRALDEARAFLRRYPQSERRGEVAVLAADLARTAGDCALAITLYETAARGRLPPESADDAAFNRAACLAASGDRRAATAARDYLARFPTGQHRAEATRLLGASTVAPGGF